MHKVYVNVRYKDTTTEEFIIESSMDAVDVASEFAEHDNFIFVTEKRYCGIRQSRERIAG